MNKIEVCFTTSLFSHFDPKNKIIVVVDILRASSVICTMMHNGVKEIIPVCDLEEARNYKAKGFLVVAERDGKKLDFADFGNSPFYFSPEIVSGKTLVYSTTNGTNAITLGKEANQVLIGSYLNISALADYLEKAKNDILILCAGWKGRFSLEDSVFAGELTNMLINREAFSTKCDSAIAAIDLWSLAKSDLLKYTGKAAQKERLQKLGLDDVIEYCLEHDLTKIIPAFTNNKLVPLT